jgi:diaminohydroxyphosphoribosylaminopyrimidine deaminase/5-amino-6-(5-phosphoribosylamino)uracil reductase
MDTNKRVATDNDFKYMRRAIQLAKCGEAAVAPNPKVGAVIVHNNKIIGEGFHRKYGGAHAEVNAIYSAKIANNQFQFSTDDEDVLNIFRKTFAQSTIYVTLEPCSHWGKTPPCCELIIKCGFKRVVIGALDPNSKVNGQGIKRMREAEIDVITGILEKECCDLNPDFHTFHSKHRPTITLKWAQLSDGTIGIKNDSNRRLHISTPFTQMLTHRLRARCQAIMVGTTTALQDRPSLTTRLWRGNSPIRVTIDRKNQLEKTGDLFSDKAETIVYHNEILSEILFDLHKRGVQYLLVEGGSKLLQSFIDSGLWDDARIEISPNSFTTTENTSQRSQVFAPSIKNAKLADEYHVDGHKLLILLNSTNI